MPRAFLSTLDADAALLAGSLSLDAETSKRFVKVLRLEDGDRVEVFGNGQRLEGALSTDGKHPILIDLVTLDAAVELAPLTIAQAFTKPSKLEDVVRKAAEMGASRVFLFVAARTQGRPKDDKRTDALRDRLQRIANDASRQSGRSAVCIVDGPHPFEALCAAVTKEPALVVFGVLGAPSTLSQTLAANRSQLETAGMVAVIGPEGGLSEQECQGLDDAGAVGVRLAAHTLRTETAGLAALAAAQVALGTL